MYRGRGKELRLPPIAYMLCKDMLAMIPMITKMTALCI